MAGYRTICAGLAVILACGQGASAQENISPAEILDRGNRCVSERLPAQRLQACSDAIRSNGWTGKALAWAHSNRATAYMALDRFESAASDLEKALALDPTLATAYFNRALLRYRKGELADALTDLNEAARFGAPEGRVAHLRGQILAADGASARAVPYLERAMADEEPGAAFALAALRCGTGDITAARDALVVAIRAGYWDVKEAQQFLKDRALYTGPIDGDFGRNSRGALLNFLDKACARP